MSFAVQVTTLLGEIMLHLYTKTAGVALDTIPASGEVRCSVPRCPLPPGQYAMTIWADSAGEPLDWIQRACELTVREGDFFGSGQAQLASHTAVLVDHGWAVSPAGGDPAEATATAGRQPQS